MNDIREQQLLVLASFVVVLLSIFVLVFATELPPIQDYPNHLARYWLIAGGAKVAPTSAMFAVDWRNASTNIGADLLLAGLATVSPYWIAGKLVLIASLAGPCAAAAWLNRILFGRWSWWSLSFLLLAWTTTSVFGFVNYQLSLAAALLFACLDALAPWSSVPKFVARAILAAVVLLIHPFGLLFYIALLLALTIGPSWSGLGRRRRLIEVGRNAVLPIAAAIIPIAALVLLSPQLPGEHHNDLAQATVVSSRPAPYLLFLTAASPFLTYRTGTDLLFFAPVLALYVYALVVGKARTHAGMLTLGLIFCALALVMPIKIGDATFLDRRVPLMATFLLFSGALPQPFVTRAAANAAAAGMLGLDLARTLWIGSIWMAREGDVRSVKAALESVPSGASVLTVQSEPENTASAPVGRYLASEPFARAQTTLIHAPVMAIPWRKAFVPTLFAVPGQQPVRILPPWSNLKSRTLEVPDVHILDGGRKSDALGNFAYLSDWADKFDYVVAIGMDVADFQGPFAPPPSLKLVADDGYARLYRVQR